MEKGSDNKRSRSPSPLPEEDCVNGCDNETSDKCPSCKKFHLCKTCQVPNTECIPWLERGSLGNCFTNTCADCGAVGCMECLRSCSWHNAPMYCATCATKYEIIRIQCPYHYQFLCNAKDHDFGTENLIDTSDYSKPDNHGDMTKYCAICNANANYCAKMQ